MTQLFEDAGAAGKEFMDAGLKSYAALSKSAQAIAVEASEYGKKSYEAGSAMIERLSSVKSLEKAFEIQTEFARKAYEDFVAEATKLGEMYADTAKESYKPFESIIAKAK